LTPLLFDDFRRLATRLSKVWQVAIDRDRHPWYGCGIRDFTSEIRFQLETAIGRNDESLRQLRDRAGELAGSLGLQQPSDVTAVKRTLAIGTILGSSSINPDWIATTGLDETIAAAHRLSDLASNIQANVTYFQQLYEPDVFSLPVDFADRVRESLDRASAVFGPDIRRMPKVLDLADHTLAWAHHAIQAVRSVDQPARTIETLLGLDGAPNLTDLRRHSRLASLCLESARPDEGWLTTDRLEKAAMTVPSYRDKVTRRNTLRQSLLESYEPILFEMNLDAVRSDLITRFGTPLRWFKPGFYRLRSRIKLCRRDRRYPSQTLLADVDRAREVAALEGHCRAVAADVRQVLGAWYREYETEFEKVFRAMSVAKEILSLTRGSPPSALVASARLGQQPSLALINSATSLSRILSEYDGQPCPLPARAAELLESTTLSNLAAFAERLISVTTPLRRVLDAVQSLRTDSMPMSADDLLSDLDRLKSLQLDRREFEDVAADASARLGSRFTGLSSDWAALEESLASAEALVGHLAGAPPPREILSLCVKGPGAAPSLDPLARAFATFNRSRDAFTALFRGGDESAREPLNSEDFELHADQIISRRTRIDDLRDWIDFRQLEVDFLNAGLSDSFAALVGIPALPADAVVPTLEKGIYRRWLNATIDGIPALRQFRTEDHHQMLTEFRHLDQKLVRTGTGRVIAALEARNPGGRAATRGGEVSILLREANKKKRHMPIRRLFENIPTLVADLKPCLLMSPLSVAQFVGARQQFDLVIFDEASQICSEDAVGAIARGRQLVVCGDSKQLPPTSFFNQGDLEFDGDQPEDERFDVYESILDQCRTIGIHPMTLRWHYRSRHESLIAFSNRWFYDNKLVTFPSPISANEDLGVSLKLVPNGIFDRGGKADNPIEADEVVNEVLKHFRLRPTKSLGVVAFSVAQREAIADRLELKLRENPTLTEWFSGDRLETCFVKNLESVQGDERDVIIFSIGYGRDKQGRLTMNFGPLNWDGGQRRLNVAITRAREKVIVVSSISASDFKISETLRPGVLALYRYLDYAERGVEALELDLSLSQGAPDSPLEESVAGAIRELGYEVVPQVGCSKYRIDIGVLAPDRPGNFILGVECDGATYHSSYTARDRDRLRQYALESLGWRIHRIWGPDWVSRRHTETQKLRASIESALVSHHERRSDHRRPLAPVEEIVIRKVARPQPDVTSANTSSWAFPYRVCSIKTDPPRNLEFHDPASSSNLRQMMLEVLATESPIHIDLLIRRLADRWGLQRIGDRMRKAAERALAQLRRADPSIRKNGDVVTRLEDDSAIEVRQPVDGEPETIRRIELVPPEEIAEAIRHLIRDAFSLSETDVVAQVARIFGFDRTGSIIRETVSKILNDLREKGSVQESDGRLTARDAN
jgi:very-short-patch-repair endonuclease